MARVTVEDCLNNVDNRFQLVLLAAKRARQIAMGMTPLVDEGNDKPTVLALREIAEEKISAELILNPPAPPPPVEVEEPPPEEMP